MPVTKDLILKAVEGKASERLLNTQRMEDYVAIRYPEPQTERQDNLHKQSIRSLVQRIAPDWKIHIMSMDDGFSVEVRPKPSSEGPQTVTERPPDIDLTDPDKLRQLSEELERLSRELASLV